MQKRKYILCFVLVVVAVVAVMHFRNHSARTPASTALTKAQLAETEANNRGTKVTDGFNKAKYSTTNPNSLWVILNKQHPLAPLTYAPTDLMPIGNGMELRKEAAKAYLSMSAAAQKAGYTLTPQSGYRSYQYQVQVFNSIVTGYSQAYAETYSAHPGYSEHQSGWAVDIGSGDCQVDQCFADIPAGKWVYANAYKYGFILRYTPADESITGYGAEAWHFRYVGPSLAAEMRKDNVPTLEQFFGTTGGPTYKAAATATE